MQLVWSVIAAAGLPATEASDGAHTQVMPVMVVMLVVVMLVVVMLVVVILSIMMIVTTIPMLATTTMKSIHL